MDNPGFGDYGYVLLDISSEPPQVAAWATVDFVADAKGDLGMFTLEEYRRRGLAYLVTAAAIEHGLANGLQQINWTCMEDNKGSIRTAEKLGLTREPDYSVYYLIFDPVEHRSMLAYTMLEIGQYQTAVEALEQIITTEKAFPPYVYFDAACALAALRHRQKALEYLNKMADGGSKDLKAYQENELLRALHGMVEWDTFLGRIRENALKS